MKKREMETWQVQEAKGRFSELVQRALNEGPQSITLRGEPVAMLMSEAEYRRLAHPKPGFVEFMRNSPLAGLELELELDLTRDNSPTREEVDW